MQKRQYPSFNEAIADLESKGELKYHGRVDEMGAYCLYSFKLLGGKEYTLHIHYETGLVENRGGLK